MCSCTAVSSSGNSAAPSGFAAAWLWFPAATPPSSRWFARDDGGFQPGEDHETNGSAQSVSPRPRWLRASQARVDGQVVEVTANIYGRVGCVLTSEDQIVEKGDVLVELDHRQLDRNLEAAAIELT